MSFGIPSLLSQFNKPANVFGLLKADVSLLLRALGTQQPQWGIFLNNKPVITPDSVRTFDYKKEYRLADYPMEQGAFQTYNKVTTPYDVRISMTKGGSDLERQVFLGTAGIIAASLDLYDVVTPEVTYVNANIARFDYRRTSTNGVKLVTVDFYLTEIRVTVPAAFSNTAQPSSQAAQNGGIVQAGSALSNAVTLPSSPALPTLQIPTLPNLPQIPSISSLTSSPALPALPAVALPALPTFALPSTPNLATLPHLPIVY